MDFLWDFFFGPAPIAWLQRVFEPIHPAVFRGLSMLGDTWGLLLVLGLTFWFWGRRTLYVLIPLIGIEAVSYLTLNYLISIPRPSAEEVTVYETLSRSAFPSGHTYLATILWGFLYHLRRVPPALALAIPLGVGMGRLLLGAHNLGDVVAGLLLGVLVVTVYGRVLPTLREWLHRPSFRAYATVAAALFLTATLVVPYLSGNPRRMAAAGIVAAAALVLPLEYRWVRLRSVRTGRRIRSGGFILGSIGLVAAWFANQGLPFETEPLAAATGAAATVWIFGVAPLLIRAAGLEKRPDEPDPTHADGRGEEAARPSPSASPS